MNFTNDTYFDFDRYAVNDYVQQALVNYFVRKLPPGSFLTAVLSNDLVDAAGRADHINTENLASIAKWVANRAPTGSWGSREHVASWLRGNRYTEQFDKEYAFHLLKKRENAVNEPLF